MIAALNFPHFETPYCFVGHTHTPIIFQLMGERGDTEAIQPAYREQHELNGSRLIVNPGSVGQPRDSNKDASYGILHVQEAVFEYRRIPYPIHATQDKMRRLGMPDRLITRLEHGW